jgi:septin family protein
LATAAAINLERVARWLMDERPEATRISPFAVLASPTGSKMGDTQIATRTTEWYLFAVYRL